MIEFLNQPSDETRIGDVLLSELSGHLWESFQAVIAFVKRSGVKHIQKALSDFSKRWLVQLVVGIDQDGTTEEGLQMLLDAVEDRGQIFVFHNLINTTFHPKFYLFKSAETAKLILGSNNLTEGGLYTNYEAALVVNLDIAQKSDRQLLGQIDSALKIFAEVKNGVARLLTPELLKSLVELKAVPSEGQVRSNIARKKNKEVGKALIDITGLFKAQYIRRAPTVQLDRKYVKPHEKNVNYDSIIEIEEPRPIEAQGHVAEDLEQEPNTILIKFVPRAGGRTSQVHFTLENMEYYFHLQASQPIRLRQRQPGEAEGEIEHRQLVLSQVNKNAKIEVAGARILVNNYPRGDDRPILIFRKIEDDLYDYMLIMPGSFGYTKLNSYLKSLPGGRSLASEMLTIWALKNIWPAYPD